MMELQLFGNSLLCQQAISFPHNTDGALNDMMIDLDVACNDDATATAPYLCTSPTLISHHENTGVCLTILRVRPTFTSAIVQAGKSLNIDVLDVHLLLGLFYTPKEQSHSFG